MTGGGVLNLYSLKQFSKMRCHEGAELERGMGMCGPEDSLLMLSPVVRKGLIQAKESVHKTPFLRNIWKFIANTASIFTQTLASTSPQIWKFSAHKPPYLEIFSSQAPIFGNFQFTNPPFQRQKSPTLRKSQAAHPNLKKVECPPCHFKAAEKALVGLSSNTKLKIDFTYTVSPLMCCIMNFNNFRIFR